MRPLLSWLTRPTVPAARRGKKARRLGLERLEDRVNPIDSIFVSTPAVTHAAQYLKEFSTSGTLIRTVEIPAGGVGEVARDLVIAPSGTARVYNRSEERSVGKEGGALS